MFGIGDHNMIFVGSWAISSILEFKIVIYLFDYLFAGDVLRTDLLILPSNRMSFCRRNFFWHDLEPLERAKKAISSFDRVGDKDLMYHYSLSRQSVSLGHSVATST